VLQALSSAALVLAAAARRAERRLVRQLRGAPALAPESAVPLDPRSAVARWQLGRLTRSGAIVHAGGGRYYLDAAGLTRHRAARRRRAVRVLGLVLPLAALLWWWQLRP
jgi:hypothetical protein